MQTKGRRITAKNFFDKVINFSSLLIKIFAFKKPFHLLNCYIRQKPPKNNRIELQNGQTLLFSSNEHDLITVLGVLGRKDYGTIKNQSFIIDIGANIGAFCIYASQFNPKQVIAVEPNSEAFGVLKDNIHNNKLEQLIIPIQYGIAEKSNIALKMPKSASPYSCATETSEVVNENEFETIYSISLPDIISNYKISSIDLLKVDCEGAEYDMFYHLDNEYFNMIQEIRMELHKDKESRNKLILFIESKGFKLTKRENLLVWFEKNK